jgi:hypothetical protein
MLSRIEKELIMLKEQMKIVLEVFERTLRETKELKKPKLSKEKKMMISKLSNPENPLK